MSTPDQQAKFALFKKLCQYVEEHITFGSVSYELLPEIHEVLCAVYMQQRNLTSEDAVTLWKVIKDAQRLKTGPPLPRAERLAIVRIYTEISQCFGQEQQQQKAQQENENNEQNNASCQNQPEDNIEPQFDQTNASDNIEPQFEHLDSSDPQEQKTIDVSLDHDDTSVNVGDPTNDQNQANEEKIIEMIGDLVMEHLDNHDE